MKLTFPIVTVSEANRRDGWQAKYRRKRKQQEDFTLLWRSAKQKVELPATVIFTRCSCRILDDDNLRSAFKAIRDSLAKEIGIDDGSPLIKFDYRQEKIKKGEIYFTVEIREI
jgi:hypothetical protein